MYTIQADLLLEMTAIQPHEELLADGKLTIFDKELGRAAFVSHQWIGQGHPDPEFKQMKVLQDTLRNLFSGASEVSVDLITEAVYFRSKGMTTSLALSLRINVIYRYKRRLTVSLRTCRVAISSWPCARCWARRTARKPSATTPGVTVDGAAWSSSCAISL